LFEKFLLYLLSKSSKDMYTLDCNYYQKEFRTVDELLTDVLESGTDPNYEILRNGKPTGETAWDLIGPVA